MKEAVLFAGLPRNPSRFKSSVSELNELREDGLLDRIIFATDTGSLEELPDLRDHLHQHQVEIIESETRFSGRGTIWYQMQDLDVGLEALPEDCNVLKTRTDIHIEQEFLKRLFSGQITDLHTSAGSSIFENRVWVPWFEIQTPFVMSDYCFYGTHSDIQKLVNYDARYDVLYDLQKGIAGTRRYIHPYLSEYPFLTEFLENYKGLDRNPDRLKHRQKLLELRLNSPVFCAFLGFYYKVLMEDFYIDYSPVTYKDVSEMENRSDMSTEVDNYDIFTENFKGGPESGRHDIYCTDYSWLQSHFEEPISEDVPREIINGINRDLEEWKRFEVDEERVQYDVEQENRVFELPTETPLPENRLTTFVANNILEPLGIKEDIKKATSNIAKRLKK